MPRQTEDIEADLIEVARQRDGRGEPTRDAQLAKEALLELNGGLLKRLALKYAVKPEFPQEDAEQEAAVGYLIALERFDRKKNCKLSTYAVQWITTRLRRANPRNRNAIRIPYEKECQLRSLDRADQLLRQRFGRSPTTSELAEELGEPFTPAKVEQLLQMPDQPVSLDQPVKSEDGENCGTLFDLVIDEVEQRKRRQPTVDPEVVKAVQEVFSQLSDRQQQILGLHYGLPPYNAQHSIREIAQLLEVSRTAAWQAQWRALTAARKRLGVTLPPSIDGDERASRNARILQRHGEGATHAELGKEFALSLKHIKHILANQGEPSNEAS